MQCAVCVCRCRAERRERAFPLLSVPVVDFRSVRSNISLTLSLYATRYRLAEMHAEKTSPARVVGVELES